MTFFEAFITQAKFTIIIVGGFCIIKKFINPEIQLPVGFDNPLFVYCLLIMNIVIGTYVRYWGQLPLLGLHGVLFEHNPWIAFPVLITIIFLHFYLWKK
ncbi:MAG: hypothetical protein WA432_01385 [Candidatus Babeliaceae bacterium]